MKKKDENIGVNDLEPFVMSLEKLGEKKLALQVLDAFSKQSKTFFQYENLAKCYFKLKDYNKSINYGEKALALSPNGQQSYVTRSNLINVYNHANYPEKAWTYITCNERMVSGDSEVAFEKAYSLYLLNRRDEAEAILMDLLAHSENFDEETVTKIKFNLGTYLLYRDKFQEGMQNFIFEGSKMRFWDNTETIFSRNQKLKDIPFWAGSPEIKNLVIYAEAGIGDEIVNIRFMKHLKERGITPYWYAAWHDLGYGKERKGLFEIFTNSGFEVLCEESEVRAIPDAKWTYSMHLPIYLNLTQKDLWYGPYIKTSEEFDKKYSWIKEQSELNCGIRWQGNPAYDHDLHRSYPVKQLYEALKGFKGAAYSLQRDTGIEEAKDFEGLIDMQRYMDSYEDTLSIINQMDFVITSCTSIAHAAAALGKRTFILVPISAYYTWSHSTKQSPWYGDNVTLCRQKRPRVWDEPIAELVEILKKEGYL